MATGFGLSNKGKANSAGEELQDIDWDSIPADKRGMTPTQASSKGKTGSASLDPDASDPFNESQLVAQDAADVFYDDDSQVSPRERNPIAGGKQQDSGEEYLDTGAELGAAQVKTNAKKTSDPNNGVKVKKVPLPGKK